MATWDDTPQGLVYTGGAFVSEDLEGNLLDGDYLPDGPVNKGGTTPTTTGITPFCRVSCLGIDWDRRSNASRIDVARFRMWSPAGGGQSCGQSQATTAGYDTHGINQVTGALRNATDGQGQSQGRDADELANRFVASIGDLYFIDSTHGFQGRFTRTDKMETVAGVQVLKRAIDIEVLNATQDRFYHPATNISASAGSPSTETGVRVAQTGPSNPDYDACHLNIILDGVQQFAIPMSDVYNQHASAPPLATTVFATQLAETVVNDHGPPLTASASGDFVTIGWPALVPPGVLTFTYTGDNSPPLLEVSGPTPVTVSWALPPSRFDTLKGVLRKASGSTAPATVTDGTGVTLSSNLATSVIDTVDPGTWSYSYFMGYGETPDSQTNETPDRYSDPVSVTVTVT